MPRITPTRLELHKLVHHRDERKGQLLLLEDLDYFEHEIIIKEIFGENITVEDPYPRYATVLSEWGVMCPHPAKKRTSGTGPWFHCGCCDSTVINHVSMVPAKRKKRADSGG